MKRGQPPTRRKGLNAMSAKRRGERRVNEATRLAVFERDRWTCRLKGVEGAGPCFGRLTPHHVRKASQGGRYDMDNLASLCSSHNDRIEAEADLAELARSLGLVNRHAD